MAKTGDRGRRMMRTIGSNVEVSTRLVFAACLLAAAAARVGRAELVRCQPGGDSVRYVMRNNSLGYRLEHPFRVFKGLLGRMSGTLEFNPRSAQEGVRVKTNWPLIGLGMDHPAMAQVMAGLSIPVGSFAIEYEASVVDAPTGFTFEAPRFSVTTFGRLGVVGGKTLSLGIPVTCMMGPEIVTCELEFTVKPGDLGFGLPKLLGVESRELVKIQGEIAFGPERLE